MASLYAQYMKELNDDEIIETDLGFASYRYLNEGKSVYIVNIYVVPEARKDRIASALADTIVDVARKRGCIEVLGTVTPSAKGSTASLKVLLGYGMTLKSSSDNMILFSKEIK